MGGVNVEILGLGLEVLWLCDVIWGGGVIERGRVGAFCLTWRFPEPTFRAT